MKFLVLLLSLFLAAGGVEGEGQCVLVCVGVFSLVLSFFSAYFCKGGKKLGARSPRPLSCKDPFSSPPSTSSVRFIFSQPFISATSGGHGGRRKEHFFNYYSFIPVVFCAKKV